MAWGHAAGVFIATSQEDPSGAQTNLIRVLTRATEREFSKGRTGCLPLGLCCAHTTWRAVGAQVPFTEQTSLVPSPCWAHCSCRLACGISERAEKCACSHVRMRTADPESR